MTITRAKLEKLVNDLLERTKQPCHQCMKDAGVTPKDIHEVSTKIRDTEMPISSEAKNFYPNHPTCFV